MALSIPDTAVCLGCRYQLRGLENPVCPECGRRFSPDDRRTFGDLFHRGTYHRWTHPPRRWLRYVVMAWAVVSLTTVTKLNSYLYDLRDEFHEVFSNWFRSPFGIRVLTVILVFAFAIFLQHFAMWRLTNNLHRAGAPPPVSKLMKWWWAPLCLGLVLSVAAYPWPIWLRFQFSRSAMETVAKQQIAVGTGLLGDRICGGFLLDGVLIYSGPVALLSLKGHRGGFVYSPDPQWERDFAIPLTRNWSYTPRWGNWR